MNRRQLDELLDLLAAGDGAAAISALAALEWRAFERRDPVAGEYGYARTRVEQGDFETAMQVLVRLREGRR